MQAIGLTDPFFVIDVDEFLFLGDPGHHPTGAASAGAPDGGDLDGLDAIV